MSQAFSKRGRVCGWPLSGKIILLHTGLSVQTLLEDFIMPCHVPTKAKTRKRTQDFISIPELLEPLRCGLSLSHINYKIGSNSNVSNKSTRLVSWGVFFPVFLNQKCLSLLQLLGEGEEKAVSNLNFFFLFWNVGLQHQDKSKETSWFWSSAKLRPVKAGVSAAGRAI